ncbi:hypothetical protein ACWGKR_29300 [Bacillus thuringiensis]|uniref:hypothetical protein n=1 Tax=Bacillus thuringiensis TaxID=1428 RepID=UPI0035D77AF6
MEKKDFVHEEMKNWKSTLQSEQKDRLEDLEILRLQLEVSNAKIHCYNVLLNEVDGNTFEGAKTAQEVNDLCMEEEQNNREIIEEIQEIEEKVLMHGALNQKLISIIDNNLQ